MPWKAPVYSDFTKKKVKDLFKFDKYDLGQSFELKKDCSQLNLGVTGKVSIGDQIKPKLILKKSADWGSIEWTQDLRKGITFEFKTDKVLLPICKNTSTKLKYDASKNNQLSVDTTTYKGFWNVKTESSYNHKDQNKPRVCKTKISSVIGDEGLGLCVGGNMQFVSKPSHFLNFSSFSLGFFYQHNPQSAYSLIFDPQTNSGGLDYTLTGSHEVSKKCQVAFRVKGPADTRYAGISPVITFAGVWGLSDKQSMQVFSDSKKQWGVAYKFEVSDNLNATVGVSNLANNQQSFDTRFGYKLNLH